MSPLHPCWRENRKEHLSVNVSACDCTITLWYAELTQLMSLMAWRAKYHVRRKPLCVWARAVNLGWSPQHCKSSRVDRFNPVRAFYTKECRCSYRDRTVIQERAPDAFLQPTALFTKNDLIKKKNDLTCQKASPWPFISWIALPCNILNILTKNYKFNEISVWNVLNKNISSFNCSKGCIPHR